MSEVPVFHIASAFNLYKDLKCKIFTMFEHLFSVHQAILIFIKPCIRPEVYNNFWKETVLTSKDVK